MVASLSARVFGAGRRMAVFVFAEGTINQGRPRPAVNHCACASGVARARYSERTELIIVENPRAAPPLAVLPRRARPRREFNSRAVPRTSLSVVLRAPVILRRKNERGARRNYTTWRSLVPHRP